MPRQPLSVPHTLLFDWHGTLVNTLDAMFEAMEEMLPQLEDLNLVERLLPESECTNEEDAKLVRYIRIFRRLHPKILAERRVSRTDIFNAIFGQDIEAKKIAHEAYNQCYRNYYGQVHPFQDGVRAYLSLFKQLGLQLGVATNRSREFLDHELQIVDEGEWAYLIDTTACANDVTHYKPAPDIIEHALASIGQTPSSNCWYVGDSYQDMITARSAGVTAIFYNGGCWDHDYIYGLFRHHPEYAPDAIVDSFDQLVDVLNTIQTSKPDSFKVTIADVRPPAFAGPTPPAERIEADWHPSVARLTPPHTILFDWHATLVDTLDAMYHAVDDMLPELRQNGLLNRMADPQAAKSAEDARLIEYVQAYNQLHPKVRADRKISRTDIFEVLFGEDQEAKQAAHKIFNHHYRNHYGTVLPFEPKVRHMLEGLRALPVVVGVITNRDREFFTHELAAVENIGWSHLFDTNICGDDTPRRKPHPDQLLLATEHLGRRSDKDVWYVGDSTTDVIAAKEAGMTAVFFNGAQWDQPWLNKIFPGTERFPFKPDVVVNDFSEFWALVLACRNKYSS